MMQHTGKHNAIPEEIFAKRGSQCTDTIMSITVFVDISKVQHHPADIGGSDLGDCYNSGSHPPTNIDMQTVGIPINGKRVLLLSLEMMQPQPLSQSLARL